MWRGHLVIPYRWLLVLFPALRRIPTEETGRRAHDRALRAVREHPRSFWLFCGFGTLYFGGIVLLSRIGFPVDSTILWAFGLVLIANLGIFKLGFGCRGILNKSLWRDLASIGVPCCTLCGYDLTGNESGKCPECGKVTERVQ